MRNRVIYIVLIIITLGVNACEIDNYSPPSATFSGRLLNGDKPLYTEAGYMFELWEREKYEDVDKIGVHINQEGEFQSLLFKGKYQFVPNGEFANVPWLWEGWEKVTEDGAADTITVEINGPKKLDIQVRPFFDFSNINFRFDEDILVASYNLSKLVEDAEVPGGSAATRITQVTIHVSPNVFYDVNGLKASSRSVDLDEINEVSFANGTTSLLSDYYAYVNNRRQYLYARLSVRTRATSILIFSDIYKVEVPEEVYQKYVTN